MAQQAVVSIPIQRDRYWIVEARSQDGTQHPVLLDTGASSIVLDDHGPLAIRPMTADGRSRLIRQGSMLAEAAADNTLTIETNSDPQRSSFGMTPAMRIQNWSLPEGQAALQGDIAGLATNLEVPLQGIIGAESMRNLTWRADYVAGRLTAYAGEAPAHDWQQCTFMTLAADRVPLIAFGLGGDSFLLRVDTGSDTEFAATQEGFQLLSEAKHFSDVGIVYNTDVTGRFLPAPQGILGGLSIGTKGLPKVSVSGGTSQSHIGLGLLSKFDRFEMDFRDYRFCFDLPAAPVYSRPSRTGAAMLRDGDGYHVVAVSPHGRLGKSGVKEGDRLLSVDGTAASKLASDVLYELLDRSSSKSITVQRDGKTLSVKLSPIWQARVGALKARLSCRR